MCVVKSTTVLCTSTTCVTEPLVESPPPLGMRCDILHLSCAEPPTQPQPACCGAAGFYCYRHRSDGCCCCCASVTTPVSHRVRGRASQHTHIESHRIGRVLIASRLSGCRCSSLVRQLAECVRFRVVLCVYARVDVAEHGISITAHRIDL